MENYSYSNISYILAAIIFIFGIIGFYIPSYVFKKNQKNIKFKINANIIGIKINLNKFISAIESFASGIFLAISLVHILPDALSSNFGNKGDNNKILLLIIFGIGFLFFLFIDHFPDYFSFCKNNNENKEREINIYVIIFSWISLIIHSFFAGVAMGFSANNIRILVGIFFAIIFHKYFVSFSLTTKFLKTNKSNFSIFLFMTIFSLATPLGIILSQTIKVPDVAAFLLIFSAGMLLYLGTLHELDHSTLIVNCCRWQNFLFVIMGFLGMSALAFWS